MNNRIPSFPILFVLSGLLFLLPPLPAADTPPAPSASSPATNSAPATADQAPLPGTEPAAPAPATYTVLSGDSLWDIAHKFHTTTTKLKKANGLKSTHLKPGQVLKIPAAKKEKAKNSAPVKTTSLHKKPSEEIAFHSARRAEPVQDFDLPASTFASCPVPIPSGEADEPSAAPAAAPREQTVPPPALSPEMAESEPLAPASTLHPLPPTAPAIPPTAPAPLAHRAAPAVLGTPEYSFAVPPSQPQKVAPADHRGLFSFFYTAPPSPDWGARFTQVARDLGNRGLSYDDDWCPPGESHSWTMDCSNTTRYLYKVTTGILLPRTASDQYYYLHLQNKAWDVPQTASGFADCNYLRQNLKAGDLLFWENTYRPERQPPITHVMVYLGTNARGQWMMAGSQTSRGGEHNRSHGGPDIYVFDPTKPCGGYSTWMGLVHHQGRFCAYGRPLEADKSKLAVAAND